MAPSSQSGERTPLLMTKAQASRGMEGSFPFSGPAIMAGALFGVAVGALGGKQLLNGVSAPQMASIQHTGQTTQRGQIVNTEYTPKEHEFSHCLTTQMDLVTSKRGKAVTGHLKGSEESYAGWISDGSAKSKLESMEREELLHPIGSVMDANAQKIKIYLQPYMEQEISEEGAPLADVRAQVDDIKADIMTTCGNPLPEIDELGLLSNTSAACADTLYGQSGAVYDSYKLCQQTVTEEFQKLDDYSQFQDQDFALTSQQDNVKELWEARKTAGEAYDAAFQTWFDAHNDALAACSYATNYQDLSSKVEDKFVSVLTEEKSVISKQCDNIPSLDDFEVTSVKVKGDKDKGRSLLEDAAANPCSSIMEALDGVSISQSSEHSGRALCLEYYCETASTKTEPEAKGQAQTLLKAYNKAATAYSKAASGFGKNKKAHDDFKSAITTNLELIQGTQETVQGIQNATDDLKADFLITAACPISTICCKTAQEIPEICARDAAGEVADAVLPVLFTLRSPPPPPSPPPFPPPPFPPPLPAKNSDGRDSEWTHTPCAGTTRWTITPKGTRTVTDVVFRYTKSDSCKDSRRFSQPPQVTSTGGTSSPWSCNNHDYFICAFVDFSDKSRQYYRTFAK